MEIHHHPDLHHNKKKFREYFLEFVMIFLAVSMGFIAESFREHITNRSKEREYIAAFIRNAENDTADLRHVINFDKQQVKGIDSFLQLAHAPMNVDSNRKTFYYLFIKYFFNSSSFKSDDATLQQLKNTGDYRIIEKDHVADSLSNYDASVHSIYTQGAYYESYFKEIISRLDEITDMTVFGDSSYFNHSKMTDKPFPALNDSAKLKVLFNKVYDFRIVTYSYREFYLIPQLQNTTNLIAFLKNEYGFSDDVK